MGRTLDFKHDSIFPLLLKTSIPLLLASTVTMIVQLASIAFMGNISATDIYIRALYTPFAFLTIALTEGFQISNQLLIARLKGSGKQEELKRTIVNMAAFSIGISFIVAVLIYLTAPVIAAYYQVPADISGAFVSFLSAMFFVNILVIVTMVVTSSLRGAGYVNLSVLLNILYAGSNISLVYLFAFHAELGIFSIVYANLISSIVFTAIAIVKLHRYKLIEWKRQYAVFYQPALIFLRNIGLPISLSYIIIFISNFLFNRIVTPFGMEAVSGFGVAYSIQTFVIIPAIAIGSSLGIIMNSNIGAGIAYYSRVLDAYKVAVLFTMAVYAVIGVSLLFSYEAVVGVMLEDTVSIGFASDFIRILAPSYFIMGLVLMALTTLEQINKGVIALVLNAAYFAVIAAVGWYLTQQFNDLTYFYWTFFTVNMFGGLCAIYTWRVVKKEYGDPAILQDDYAEASG
ncbi:hypothetical protein FLK61_24045 [Paenalkalicoccus suaedae]|uniref:MATE family efflux transporter n=1 Tax=Paenalkalicoccus suaedae TaxID=2592382 RepID=A0A859FAR0_9BACI|nr:MATE family efflux transporter [Paenalkalicoccus suaedae]QKS69862.1 hypothetical protein FLK61_24045 [Paenalkalicoccus suaedae]